MLRRSVSAAFGAALLAAGSPPASGSAAAADLPAYAAPLPAFAWTGIYAGANLGGAFDAGGRGTDSGLLSINGGVADGDRPRTVKLDAGGVSFGGQVGYNYQLRHSGLVVGAEADLAYTDLATSGTYDQNNATSAFRSGQDYLGTVRGRLGYAFDRVLVYGTGGFAYGDVFDRDVLYAPGGSAVRFLGSRDSTQTGYTVGGGVEYALRDIAFLNGFGLGASGSSAVTVRAEYLYYNLGSGTVAAVNPANAAAGGYATKYAIDGNLVRVGLNYKF